MIIVDRIKKPAPKWVPPPKQSVFKTTLDRTKYWEQQKVYWREGYGDGYSHISGMHTFYLTQGHLKDGSDGTLIKPRYRDCDEWMIEPLHNSFWSLNRHEGLIKRREIGATSIGAGLLPAYTFRMFPNSIFGMTSCDKDRISRAYKDKTDPFIKNLDIDIRPSLDKSVGFKETSSRAQNVSLELPFLVNGENGPEYNIASLFAKETSDSDDAAKGFSSARLRAAYYDEFALHKRRRLLLSSSKSCFMKGIQQSGLLYFGGTVEYGLTPEQITDLKNIINDAKLMNFNITFAPAWWGLIMDENGVSNKKAGIAWVESELERLSKMDDKTDYYAFKMNYPLLLDDIFELSGSDCFNEYAREKIRLQSISIGKAKEELKPKQYSIVYHDNQIHADPTDKGHILILEHPKPGVKYVLGNDGLMTSDLTSSESHKKLSKYSTMVMKGIDPQSPLQFAPVALYLERPKSIESANLNSMNLLRYFNQFGMAKITGELNAAGEHLIQMLKNHGLWNTVIHRKVLANQTDKKPWFTRSDDMKEWQYEAANMYMKNYAEMIWFIQLLEDAAKKIDANKDVMDSFLACLAGFGTGDLLGENKARPKEPERPVLFQRWTGGKVEYYDPRTGITVS